MSEMLNSGEQMESARMNRLTGLSENCPDAAIGHEFNKRSYWSHRKYACSTRIRQALNPGLRTLISTTTGDMPDAGFPDARQKMRIAFLGRRSGRDANGFHCAAPEAASDRHAAPAAVLRPRTGRSAIDVDHGAGT
ncbi:MAG: hypothetical protein OXC91_07585 [Rhodobacteraceae bacterium]|nr:hypothetical protein [Paracoccaceae bacterium]